MDEIQSEIEELSTHERELIQTIREIISGNRSTPAPPSALKSILQLLNETNLDSELHTRLIDLIKNLRGWNAPGRGPESPGGSGDR